MSSEEVKQRSGTLHNRQRNSPDVVQGLQLEEVLPVSPVLEKQAAHAGFGPWFPASLRRHQKITYPKGHLPFQVSFSATLIATL